MLKEITLLAAVAAVLSFVAFGAQAMPTASLKGAKQSVDHVTTVAGGCGRGWHRGPGGHCVRN